MTRSSAQFRTLPNELPLELPAPFSADSVRPGPSYFIIPVACPANSNELPRKRLVGDPKTGTIRAMSLFGTIGKLIAAVIGGRRPTWDCFYSYSEDEFYDRLCSVGADIIFLHASHKDLFQRIKLDPTFYDIPLVMIDSWDDHEFPKRRERYLKSGADAVLFVPVLEQAIMEVVNALLPGTQPDPTEE